MIKIWGILVGLITILSSPQTIFAHGIGQVFTLPIPLTFYLWGAGLAVFISFVVIGYFIGVRKSNTEQKKSREKKLLRVNNLSKTFLKTFSLLLFLLIIVAGIFGNQDPRFNFAPNFIWAFFVIAFVVASATLGNFWQFLNPFKIIFSIYEKILGENASLNFKYPKFLACWPAVFLYFAFIWLELVSGFSDQPRVLAFFVIFYSLIIFWGMILFDRNTWLRRAEIFTVLANLISYLSPIGYKRSTIFFSNPVKKITNAENVEASHVAFIILTLAGVAFDSFGESSVFFTLISYFNLENLSIGASRTIGLVFMILPFLILYILFSVIGKFITKSKISVNFFVNRFALALLPISFAYFIAHFYSLLLIQGQALIYLISDPLGIGWNIFGTRGFKINVGLLDAGFVWYSQVALIVLGHIAAVYLAHLIALKVFKKRKQAMLSQYPMTTLMIIYTVFSLWLLSLPIVISPN